MKKGDIIKFGNYPQGEDITHTPIEWIVLDVNENEALLISRYGLDCKKYHHEKENITWEDCDLRKWLNRDFLKSAFSNEESERILVSELRNDNNPEYGTPGGNDTKDRIFCLSIAEAKQYFSSNKDRQCRPTAYVRKQRAYVNNDCCYWMLRSPGSMQDLATRVSSDGALDLGGSSVGFDYYAVRPALRIIFDETLEQRNRREEEERRQKELLAQAHEEFSAIIKKGMIIPFGAYPQDNDCFRTPIEWLVLDVKGNEALIISRYGLDCKPYHYKWVSISWEDCDLRKWLNSDFLKSAFSNEESERILVSELRNDDNPEYGTTGGNDTKDRIFCLSIAEAKQYFSSNKDRQCRPTAYARNHRAYVKNDCCDWWLRSPGLNKFNAAFVHTGGALSLYGDDVNRVYGAVRPALRIIFDETLEQRNRREEEKHRQREEQERRQRELLAQAHEEFSAIIKKGIRKGMIIPFGAYPQDNYSFRTPIEWLVLDVKGNEALLISRYGLDCKRYHPRWENTTWEDCELRKWLNSDFLKSAFSNEESERILVSELKNDNNPEYGTRGGNDTKDRIFCLSIAEAQPYYISNEDRQCRPTAYARKQGAYVNVSNDCCCWWLRSPGGVRYDAPRVTSDGSLFLYGLSAGSGDVVVRPALRIICKQRKQREEEERRQRELLAQAHEEFSAIIKKGIRKGMIIPFGAYPQDNDSFRTPIEWLVLDVKKTNFLNRVFAKNKLEVLLISRYGLDCKQYHPEWDDITWEDCELRKWLNRDFLKSAFSNEESERILVSELKNDNNPEWGTLGGNDTKDRIFCLSIAEAEQYFSSDKDRQCRPTAYARKQGAFVKNDCCYWMLRSPGYYRNDASYVYACGALCLYGSSVNDVNNAVRPALRIICNL